MFSLHSLIFFLILIFQLLEESHFDIQKLQKELKIADILESHSLYFMHFLKTNRKYLKKELEIFKAMENKYNFLKQQSEQK